jgi:ParB-like chromosome segregation protein Spo0J
MENREPHQDEISLPSLVLRYAHTRIARPKALNMMITSIDRYGQITPVIVVEEESIWVLIDGYLRVQALTHLGRDVVAIDICPDGEMTALFQLLSRCGERQWQAVEQAWIIRDVKDRFGCSSSEIARHIGHDVSWVSRRLSLLDDLSDDMLEAVLKGQVSVWSATRVLAPLARANPSHAQRLTQHLLGSPQSSRDLMGFLRHYERSNKQTRDRMVDDPALFFKAHKSKDGKKLAQALDQGPEGEWLRDFEIVTSMLRRLLKKVDIVIYEGQHELDRSRLISVFDEAMSVIIKIEQKIRKVDVPWSPKKSDKP